MASHVRRNGMSDRVVRPSLWRPRAPSVSNGAAMFWKAAMLGLVLQASLALAQHPGVSTLDETVRQDAIATIPFDKLDERARQKLTGVVRQPSIFRRMPLTVVESDPEMYLFLIRYPEVVVNMWQLMGVTKVQVQRTGEFTLDAADGSGTAGQIELVYGDRDKHVYYSEGAYEGPLFRRLIRGRCVLVLTSEYRQTADQRVYVTSRLDMFVQLDNIGAELLAKTLQPLVGKTADQNFVESSRFIEQVTLAAETKPDKLQNVGERLSNVEPKLRTEFVSLTQQVAGRAAQRGGLHLTDLRDQDDPLIESEVPELQPVSSAETIEPSPKKPQTDSRLLR